MNKTSEVNLVELNQKVDLILEYVNQQRLKSEAIDDLISDFSIVGKDVFDTTVKALDDSKVEIYPEELQEMGIRLIRNVRNINIVLDFLESMTDLAQDVTPIANEVIIDATKKLHEFEQKGYFEFIKETGKIIDNIVTHYNTEDVKALADNIVTIMETVKSLTQPEMMKSMNNALTLFGKIDFERAPKYSMFKLIREMRSAEMKKAMGFVVTLMKSLVNENQ